MRYFGIASVFVIAALVFIALMPVNYMLGEYECKQMWQDSGFAYKYSLVGGCKIQTKPNVWIPAQNYREL